MKVSVLALFSVFALSCTSSVHSIDAQKYEYEVALDKVNAAISSGLSTKGKLRVAVLPVLNEKGDQTGLGSKIDDDITNGLFSSKNLILVERERIDSLLSEIEFSMSSLVDSKNVAKLGELLAVDTIVVGTLREEADAFSLYARALDIKSGRILASASVYLKSTENVRTLFGRIVEFSSQHYVGAYELQLGNIKISETRDDGQPWDALSAPDLSVVVSVDDEKVLDSRLTQDSSVYENAVSTKVILKENSVLTIRLYDADVSQYETVGTIRLTKKNILQLRGVGVMTFAQGHIEQIKLSMKKIE